MKQIANPKELVVKPNGDARNGSHLVPILIGHTETVTRMRLLWSERRFL